MRAIPGVVAQYPEALFVFVGDGQDREQLQASAREQGIADRVLFTGARADMPEVYASLDIMALPSISEGMPMAILEAMGAGKPVVATRVGAVPKLVSSETGALVEPRDVGGLQKALIALAGDAAGRQKRGEQARALVEERYSARAMARKYVDVYEQVCQLRGRAQLQGSR
jgi:glycosyltransferase involved in cell wall biosynthesis